jgi:hypothetical protein
MSALKVEWITFTSARETIIAEVSRQLNLEDEFQLNDAPSTSSLSTTTQEQKQDLFSGIFQKCIWKEYRHDFVNNTETMKVLILPPIFCSICLIIASALHSFYSLVLYPMIVSVLVLVIIATLNVITTLRYKKAERYELKDQVCGILEHYATSIESSNIKHRVGSFLENSNSLQQQQPPGGGDKDNDKNLRAELNSGHSHVCIVSVYRERQWQRLPSLLLVKGDIISLMVRMRPNHIHLHILFPHNIRMNALLLNLHDTSHDIHHMTYITSHHIT